jgi:FkbM family methyltransferase
MMSARHPLASAPSAQFRRKGWLETLGDRLGRAPLGPTTRRLLRQLYRTTLTRRTRGRGLRSVLPGGEVVQALPEFRYLSWNPWEYAAFREAARPGMVALDVGANVGAYSILLGQWAGARGAVYAFEPVPDLARGLAAHIELNGLADIVHGVGAAVGDREGSADLIAGNTAGESRLATPADAADGAVAAVPLVTIDGFCERHDLAPDFIKIDVEGWELSVLRGARRTIRRRRPGLALFVEMHPSIWPALGMTRDDVEAELAAQGLRAVPLTAEGDGWQLEGVCLRLLAR